VFVVWCWILLCGVILIFSRLFLFNHGVFKGVEKGVSRRIRDYADFSGLRGVVSSGIEVRKNPSSCHPEEAFLGRGRISGGDRGMSFPEVFSEREASWPLWGSGNCVLYLQLSLPAAPAVEILHFVQDDNLGVSTFHFFQLTTVNQQPTTFFVLQRSGLDS
jgi:hypothetical protein